MFFDFSKGLIQREKMSFFYPVVFQGQNAKHRQRLLQPIYRLDITRQLHPYRPLSYFSYYIT